MKVAAPSALPCFFNAVIPRPRAAVPGFCQRRRSPRADDTGGSTWQVTVLDGHRGRVLASSILLYCSGQICYELTKSSTNTGPPRNGFESWYTKSSSSFCLLARMAWTRSSWDEFNYRQKFAGGNDWPPVWLKTRIGEIEQYDSVKAKPLPFSRLDFKARFPFAAVKPRDACRRPLEPSEKPFGIIDASLRVRSTGRALHTA